jgi:hypothetical protein
MNNTFDRLEAHLRAIFEENLPKLLTGHLPQQSLINQLMQVMQDHVLEDSTGQLFAPDLYILNVHADDLIEWQMHHDILEDITSSIYNIGVSLGLFFKKPPVIELAANQAVPEGKFTISAYFTAADPDLPDTAALPQDEEFEHASALPENAMLIIAGKENFSLDKPVINIGRHSSNDLVFSDPHISRHHAQLRAIKNHFVIFDVGSTAGLYLNGKPISQATLHAGDVIRIGTVNLIYNQEPTSAFPTSAIPIDDDFNLFGDDS